MHTSFFLFLAVAQWRKFLKLIVISFLLVHVSYFSQRPQGKFHSLVQFAIESGDSILKEHLEQCRRNATYMSKTAQNDLLSCMADVLVSDIVAQAKESHFYGIAADDISGWEQLALSIRYVKDNEAHEQHVAFMACKSCTGRAVCNKITEKLESHGLDIARCRAQSYDGAGAMSGHLNGCQALFKQQVPEATYYHCSSHQLNLALTKACSVQQVQCMLSDLKSLGIFFKYSPKRQRCLDACLEKINDERRENNEDCLPKKKLKLLCDTSWVERHTALADFVELYDAAVYCIQKKQLGSSIARP